MGNTKKVKRKKFSFKKFLIVLLILYFICYAVFYCVTLPIKNIYIKNTMYLTDNEIIEVAKIKNYPSFFKYSSKSLEKKIESLDLVSKAQVSKSILGCLTIDIEENTPIFYDINSNKIALKNGTKIDNKYNYYGLPTLINYVPDKYFKKLVEELGKINDERLLLISEIEYSPLKDATEKTIDDKRFILKMNDGNTVYTNLTNLKNIDLYPEIISSTDKKGVLYLDSSNKENFLFEEYK